MKRILFLLLAFLFSAPLAAQQVIKIATLAPEGSGLMRELRTAAVLISTGTQNRVKLKIYPGGVMGGDAVVLRKLRLGQLQAGMLSASELSAVCADAQDIQMPFLFTNTSQVDRTRSRIDPLMARCFEAKGLKMLAVSNIGFSYLFSIKPIRSMEDMRASKVWIPPNDKIGEATFREAGVSAIPLPLGDVFTSLQTGLVDTVINTPAFMIALQWHGKVHYMVGLPLGYVIAYVVMDQKAWAKLSPADQAVVSKLIATSAQTVGSRGRQDDEAALISLKKRGLTVTSLPDAEIKRWREVGVRVSRKLEAEKSISPAIMAIIRQASAEAN